jgi:heme/copper-type cytochrome/quinol oxidase subunit 3
LLGLAACAGGGVAGSELLAAAFRASSAFASASDELFGVGAVAAPVALTCSSPVMTLDGGLAGVLLPTAPAVEEAVLPASGANAHLRKAATVKPTKSAPKRVPTAVMIAVFLVAFFVLGYVIQIIMTSQLFDLHMTLADSVLGIPLRVREPISKARLIDYMSIFLLVVSLNVGWAKHEMHVDRETAKAACEKKSESTPQKQKAPSSAGQ